MTDIENPIMLSSMRFENKIGYSCHTVPGKTNLLMVNTRNDVVIIDHSDPTDLRIQAQSDLTE